MAKELMEIGGFITSGAEIVNHDNTLSGNGTVDSPLGVVPGYNETVLWESNTAWSGGNTNMKANFTLSEQVSAFDKIDIYFWKKYGTYYSYEVATTPVISNTIQYCTDPFPENMLTASWFNMKLYGSGNNCGYSGGFNSVQTQSMTAWASQDMWGHGNIYKLVGINRIANN